MKKIRMLYLALIFPMLLLAQERNVTGTVYDELGSPLPDASVVVPGTTIGAATDFDGNFSLRVPEGTKTLMISYVAYKDYTLTLTDKDQYEIHLEPADNTLEEVVVIGYGTSKKKDISGALQEVKEDADVAAQYNTVGAILQGRTSGLQVTSNMGAPGAATSIRIRGANSLRGNNEPLYVIDGVIVNSAGEDNINPTTDANETQQTMNGLTGINPRDIESMTVLKDAAATAIYGSRGANGVIIITTKKGKQGKADIQVVSSSSFSNVTNSIPVLNGPQFAQYKNEYAIQQGNNLQYQVVGDEVYAIIDGVPSGEPLNEYNWQKEMYNMAYNFSVGFNMSGATEKQNYYMSFNIDNSTGVVPNTGLKSGTLQMNYSNNLTDRLIIDTRVGLYLGDGNLQQGMSRSGGGRSFVKSVITYKPIVGVDDENEEEGLEYNNPLTFIHGFEEKSKEKRLNASLHLTYKITDNLRYQMRAGTNVRTKDRSRWYGKTTGKGSQSNGYLALSNMDKTSYVIDNLLMWKKKFNKNNKLDATFGITYDGNDSKNTVYEVGDFPIDNLREKSPQLGSLVITPHTSLAFSDNIFSVLGRATYTLYNRYSFNASFRSDSSSKFYGDNQTGFFPAFAFTWTVSNEKFLEESEVLTNMKFRASWGKVGNQAIGPYQTFNNYHVVNYSDDTNSTVVGVASLNIQNRDLTWETTAQTNFGLDLGLWYNRFVMSVDVYEKQTSDLLISLPVPTSTGFGSYLMNRGGLQNRGVDFSLDAYLVQNDNTTFSVGGNISFIKNEITDLGALPARNIYIDGKPESVHFYLGNNVSTGGYFKSPSNIFIQGYPVGLFWGYQTDGVYSSQDDAANGPRWQGNPNKAGDVKFVDLNGDGNVNEDDKTVIGNPNPDFSYGINMNFSHKNLDVQMLFTGVYGNEILNANLNEENYAVGRGNNIRPKAYFDAWSPGNPDGTYPRMGSETANTQSTDRLIQDGSYFRLGNVMVGYSLDFDNSFISNMRVYASGSNLLTFTNYNGFDPELTSFMNDGTIIGVDWQGTPNITTFVLGLNIKF